MTTPHLKPKAKPDYSGVSKRKKFTTDEQNVATFERCKNKHQQIKKLLKKTNQEEIVFQLDDDIDKALKSLGSRYEKALDKILEGIAKNEAPPIPQTNGQNSSNNG